MSLIGKMLAGGMIGAGKGMAARAERLQKEAADKRQYALADYKFKQSKELEGLRHENQSSLTAPTVQTFYDDKTGLEYKAQYDPNNDPNTKQWNRIGGTKAATSQSEKPTVQTFYDDKTGLEYKAQYDPNTKQWNRIGGAKASKPPTTGWNNKSVTDYFTKEAYRELGIEVDQFGLPIEGSSSDHNKARQWVSVAIDRWRGMQGSEDPGEIVAEVFKDSYHQDNQVSQSNQAQAPDGTWTKKVQAPDGNWYIKHDGKTYRVD